MILLTLLSIPFYKLLSVILISSIKFTFAPFLSSYYGYNYFETVCITSIGGILSVLFFYYLSAGIISTHRYMFPNKKSYSRKKKKKKTFRLRNKILVRLKSNFGLIGIVVLAPILISLPFGSFLARRYYSKNPFTLPLIFLSIIIWASIISLIADLL